MKKSIMEIEVKNFVVQGIVKTKEDGLNRAVIKLLIEHPESKQFSVEVEDKIYLERAKMPHIAAFFRSIGLKKRGVPMKMQWDNLEGLSGKCALIKNSYGDYNILRYLDKTME